MRNYYQILLIEKDASTKEIKKAFRKLALKYHPDKNPNKDTKDKFIEIYEAFDVLSDPIQRKIYDKKISRAQNKTTHQSKSSRKKAHRYASMSYESFINSEFVKGLTYTYDKLDRIFFYSNRILKVLSIVLIISFYLFVIIKFGIFAFSSNINLLVLIFGFVIFSAVCLMFIFKIGKDNEVNYSQTIWNKESWRYIPKGYKKDFFESTIRAIEQLTITIALIYLTLFIAYKYLFHQ